MLTVNHPNHEGAVSDRDSPGRHRPAMLAEVVSALEVRSGGRYVDATLGEGGFAERLLATSGPDGGLLGVDWDDDALSLSARHLERFGDRVRLVRDSFANLSAILADIGWGEGADGIIVDLGVSTYQLGRAERGFSFTADGPLDMRMDTRGETTAADLLATLAEKELADIIYRYGEERASRRIARAVVRARQQRPLLTTAELREVIVGCGVRGRRGRDPSTQTFQALRIAVNGELEQIEKLLDRGWELMRPGGRLAVLSYHSLEDRMVKQAFKMWAADCICPPVKPVCDCGWQPKVRRVTRRKQRPSPDEVASNPRARSAGLRVVERLED